MAIDVKSKGGGGVTKVGLHSLDVITGADAVDSVGMTKVMDPCVGDADTLYHALEAVKDRTVGDLASKLIGEHQAAVLPCGACH